MNDGYLSPDGKFIWTGSEWIPAPLSNPELIYLTMKKHLKMNQRRLLISQNNAQISNTYPPKPQHPPQGYPPKPQHPPQGYPPKPTSPRPLSSKANIPRMVSSKPQNPPEPNPSQSEKTKLRDKK